MTDDETLNVETLMTYLIHNTNDDQSHTDITWIEMLCMNNSELTAEDKLRIKTIRERTMGYGQER